MEESMRLLDEIKETFTCGAVDIRTYSPLTLAFIGDAVFELVVRSVLVEKGNCGVNGLHKSKSSFVNARTQAQMAEALLPLLGSEELSCYKRGRNAKSYTTAKNASVEEYRKATGLEALCGYLYLMGEEKRMLYLMKEGFARIGKKW